MGVKVEFDYEGRTYEVEGALYKWNIYAVSNLRDKISFETDLKTGRQICVSWADVSVLRLSSQVDAEGLALDPEPATPTLPPQPERHTPPVAAESQVWDQDLLGSGPISAPPPDGRGGLPPSPGWYRDPLTPDHYQTRYWDGRVWTGRID